MNVLEGNGYSCAWCGNEEKQLHAHHKMYLKGKEPWDYSDLQLECLCFECHKTAHALQDGIKEQISVMSMFQSFELYGLIAADNIWHGRSTANVNSVRGKLGDEGFKLWWGGFAARFNIGPDFAIDRIHPEVVDYEYMDGIREEYKGSTE